MSSLEKIKNRINSIETTKKITNAMKQVATVNLKKEKNKFSLISEYLNEFYTFFVKLLSNIDCNDKKNIDQKKIWVIFSSYIGLCGSFNNNIINKTISVIGKDDHIIIIGKRGYSLLKSKNLDYKIKMFLNINPKDLSNSLSDEIANRIYNFFIDNNYTHLSFIYTNFVNSLNFNPIVKEIFPINVIKDNNFTEKNNFIFEPSQKLIINNIKKLFFKVCFEGAAIESNVSENASRRNSMDTASRNADKLKDEYIIEYNRKRQAKITQEINEIIGGFNRDE